jgi:hypothetical protein
MRKFALIGLGLISGITTTFALSYQGYKIDGTAYAGYINYQNSNMKKYGSFYGATMGVAKGDYSLGLGTTYTILKFKDNTDWKQIDLTLSAGKTFKTFNLYGAVHYLNTSYEGDDFSKKGWVFYTSASDWIGNFKPFADFAYSNYKHGVKASQVDLGLGGYAGKQTVMGYNLYIYPYLKATGIFTDTLKQFGLSKYNYFSGEVGTSVVIPTIATVNLSGFAGQRVLYIDNGGYTVYNLKEKYTYGIKTDVAIPFTENGNTYNLLFGISMSNYKEVDSGKNVKVYVFYGGLSF